MSGAWQEEVCPSLHIKYDFLYSHDCVSGLLRHAVVSNESTASLWAAETEGNHEEACREKNISLVQLLKIIHIH